MQSDIMAHINGLFGGKTRRKMAEGGDDVNSDHISIGAYLADKFRRKSESAIGVGDLVNNKINSGRTKGINLIRIAKLDFKLNLKRLSLHDDVPPELPVRHFSVDDDEDLPPPIPERKGSLEMIIDEDFQGRFSFRPISTVPLPEPLSGIKKTFPSKTPRRNAIQRPPSQPPPPPPPPADEFSTASHSSVTFKLSSSQWSSQYEFDDDLEEDFPPPPPPPISGTDDTSVKQSDNLKTKDNRKSAPIIQVSTLPPPPTRPPPPAPQNKKPPTSLSTFTSSPSLLLTPNTVQTSSSPNLLATKEVHTSSSPNLLATNTVHTSSSPNLLATNTVHTSSSPNLLATNAVQTSSSPNLLATNAVHTSSSPKFTKNTTRSKKPNLPALKSAKSEPNLVTLQLASGTTSPPPPPIPVRPPLLNANKPQPAKSQHHPKLPLKPSTTSKEKLEPGDISTKPNGIIKNADLKSSQQSSKEQTPRSPQKSPLPPRQGRPSPDACQYPNRNRPLPSVPKPMFDKRIMPVKKWAGPQVYDPREEDGDLYDVMDSTQM